MSGWLAAPSAQTFRVEGSALPAPPIIPTKAGIQNPGRFGSSVSCWSYRIRACPGLTGFTRAILRSPWGCPPKAPWEREIQPLLRGPEQLANQWLPACLRASTKDKFSISVPFWSILGRFVSETGARRHSCGPKMGRWPDRREADRVGHSGPFWAVLGHCPDLSRCCTLAPASRTGREGRSDLVRVMVGTVHRNMVGMGYRRNQEAGVITVQS